MINDVRFLLNQEQPLDSWLVMTMAEVNDVIYEIVTLLTQAADEVFKDVC